MRRIPLHISFALCMCLLICCIGIAAWAQQAEALSARAPGTAALRSTSTAIGSFAISLRRYFDAPINFEYADVWPENPPIVSLEVREGETLASALERLPAEFAAVYETTFLARQVVIRARESSILPLDRHVNLLLENVSTWDAVKAVLTSVNQSGQLERPLALSMEGTYLMSHARPPDALTEEVLPEPLALIDLSVREALCRIFAQSPVKLCYTFYPDLREFSKIDIEFRGNSKDVMPDVPPTMEDLEWWRKELNSVFEAYLTTTDRDP